jgi:hypothetical protein
MIPGASPMSLRSHCAPSPRACHVEFMMMSARPVSAAAAAAGRESVRRCSRTATVMPAPNSTRCSSSDVLSVSGHRRSALNATQAIPATIKVMHNAARRRRSWPSRSASAPASGSSA